MHSAWRGISCAAVSFIMALYGGTASASIVYVNKVATGNGNGLSWENACTAIQAGVDVAISGDEVWVAKGTYTATASPSITMKEGVPIYGGFAGTETTRDARDASANATIIDGASTYQCILGASTTVLDGFTVQNAHAATQNGAGMYNASCTGLTLAHCTFSSNTVWHADTQAYGGAVYNSNSTLTITNCTFDGNIAGADYAYAAGAHGGAMYNANSTVTITNCTFNNSLALFDTDSAYGGALENTYSTVSITGSTFTSNQASAPLAYGGAISSNHCTPALLNCVFKSNLANGGNNGNGGALYSENGAYTAVNCIFIANCAKGSIFGGGGAACSYSGSPQFTNCTFTANTGDGEGYGGALYCCDSSYPVVTNCIFYGESANNGSELFNDTNATFTVTYSCVSGGWSGTGNVDANPLFVDGTDGGDGYDLRLQANSQCINKGTDTSATVPASALDILGIARPQGTAYDMGAYEYVAPVAAFSLSVSSGAVPLDVTFTDTSTTSASWPITAWAWTFGDGSTSTDENPSHTYLAAGVYSVSLTVTTANGTSTVTHSVTAERGTAPVTTWPVASAIAYGQALSASTLSGGASSISGDFTFANPAIIPNAGTAGQAVVFTATDRASYDPAYGAASVMVTQATPTVSPWPSASGLTYGQALSDSVLSGGTAAVTGTFAFARPDLIPPAGTYASSVVFTPVDTVNYTTVSSSTDVAVAKAAPVITTAPAATAITYGERLSASILTGGEAKAGTTAIAGSFSFATPSEMPGNAGEYSATITFTPADTSNYLLASGSVPVSVTAVDCPECNATTGPYTAGTNACLVVPGTFSASATFSWARQDSVVLDTTRCSGLACQRLQIANLRISDSATYECTYTDGASSDVYSVTIAVTEAQAVPAAPHGWRFAVLAAFTGLIMAWRYRRGLSA